MTNDLNPYLFQVYRRVLQGQDPALVQISFRAAVLDKYREAAGYALDRTDTVGRIKRAGGWALDLGIGEGEQIVHASYQDIAYALPESEREHWARHAVLPPFSSTFLQMRLAPGACLDDGDVRAWE